MKALQPGFAIASILIALAVSASAATFSVTTAADPGNGVCTIATIGDGCTLREAINAANAASGDDIIVFAAGVTGTIQLTSTLPVVSGNLVISGPGPDVVSVRRNTGGDYRLLTISNGTAMGPVVRISGLTLTNGRAVGSGPSSHGGAILNDRGDLTVMNCVLQDNSATTTQTIGRSANGGAIANHDGNATTEATLRVRDSIFTGNTATGSSGTSFRGNGGAIYSLGSKEVVEATNCVFTQNSATYGGGAINLNAAAGEVSHSTFRENSATAGGAIAKNSGVLNVTNSTFFNNTASAGGGAILNQEIGDGGTVVILHCTLMGNSYGGIYNTATATVGNSILQAGSKGPNLDNRTGGIFFSQGYNLSDDDGTGVLNQPGDQILTDAQLDPAGPQNHGGITPLIALLPGSPAIDKGKSYNIATDQRGFGRPYDHPAIPPANGGDNADIGAFEVSDTQLGPAFTVTNIADHTDGFCSPADCTLREAITTANLVGGPDTIRFASNVSGIIELGSALPTVATNMNMEGPGANVLTVRRNSGGSYRIFTISDGDPSAEPFVSMRGLTMTNGNLTGAGNYGAGILNDHATLSLTRCMVSGNATAQRGGGVYSDGTGAGGEAVFIANDSTFSGNTAVTGGGLYNVDDASGSAIMELTNCTVSGNNVGAGGSGGGLLNSGALTILNCTLHNNTAGINGGGLFNSGLAGGSSNVTLANNIFRTGTTGANLVNNSGAITSQGYNLSNDNGGGFLNNTGDVINTEPLLDPAGLANNGGPTLTIALQGSSLAINNGNDALAPTFDQRGYLRNGVSDKGAFEFNGTVPTPPTVVSAVSRKVHGGSGTFDISLPLTGTPGLECRDTVAGSHQVVVTFGGPVTLDGFSVSGGASPGTFSASGSEVTLNIVPDNTAGKRLVITLQNVTVGAANGNVVIPMNVLVGDTNGNGGVNTSDIGQTKAASGQAVTGSNFRLDVTASGGSITTSDIGLVKSRSGSALPP